MRRYIIPTVKIDYQSADRVIVDLVINNTSDKDLIVSEALLSERMYLWGYTIKSLKGDTEVVCDTGHHEGNILVTYRVDDLKLPANGTLKSTIYIAEICNFHDILPGEYEIQYHVPVVPCLYAAGDFCDWEHVELVAKATFVV